jgi:tight adherence protein C
MAGGYLLDFVVGGLALAALWRLFGAEARPVPAAARDWKQVAAKVGDRVAQPIRDFYPRAIRQAGLDPAAWSWILWGGKLLGAVLLPLLVVEALATLGWSGAAGWWLLGVSLLGSFVPDLWLLLARRHRRRQVEKDLPYFLDLVVAFLHSGLNLTAAFRRAGREAFPDPHPLAWEVALIGRELDAGRDPSTALLDLSERTGVPELKAVAAALRMGLRVGASIQETLRAQAEAMWTRRRESALKKLQKAEIMMLFPVMFMGFPMFLVLAFFPFVTDFLETIGQLIGR